MDTQGRMQAQVQTFTQTDKNKAEADAAVEIDAAITRANAPSRGRASASAGGAAKSGVSGVALYNRPINTKSYVDNLFIRVRQCMSLVRG